MSISIPTGSITDLRDGRYMTTEGLRDALELVRFDSYVMADVLHEMANDLTLALSGVATRDPNSGMIVVTKQTQNSAKNVGAYIHRAAASINGAANQANKAWETFYKNILGPAMNAQRQFEVGQPSGTHRNQRAQRPTGFTLGVNPHQQRRSA